MSTTFDWVTVSSRYSSSFTSKNFQPEFVVSYVLQFGMKNFAGYIRMTYSASALLFQWTSSAVSEQIAIYRSTSVAFIYLRNLLSRTESSLLYAFPRLFLQEAYLSFCEISISFYSFKTTSAIFLSATASIAVYIVVRTWTVALRTLHLLILLKVSFKYSSTTFFICFSYTAVWLLTDRIPSKMAVPDVDLVSLDSLEAEFIPQFRRSNVSYPHYRTISFVSFISE